MNVHTHAFELIPWYVNGTLDAIEMTRVQEHLAECPICAAEVDREMRISQQLQPRLADERRLSELLALQPAALTRLQTRLTGTRRRKSPAQEGKPTVAPRTVSLPFAGVVAVLIVSVITLGVFQPDAPLDEGSYEGMTQTIPDASPVGSVSSSTSPSPTQVHEAVVQIAFRPTTAEATVRRLLLASRGQLRGNPSSTGIYRISLASSKEAHQAVRYLREQPEVLWTEVEL